VLYLSLRTIAVTFCAIGVALWSTVGVVVSSPPYGNTCDLCWRGSRDGLVIAGFVFSILALIYAIATVIFLMYLVKVKQPSRKCNIFCGVVFIALLFLSVVGIPLVIMVCYKLTITQGI